MEETTDIGTPSSGGKKGLLVLLALLLLGSMGSNVWFWNQSKTAEHKVKTQLDSMNYFHALKDSLYDALAQEELKVEGLRAEINLNQTDNDSLNQLLNASMAKIASLRAMVGKGGSTASLRALKDSIAKMSVSNQRFKTQIDSLFNSNANYLAQIEAQQEAIKVLEGQRKILGEKVNIAAEPQIGAVIVTPVYNKKGLLVPIYKSKKVEKLQIMFDVLGNQLTENTIQKTYFLRIIDPDGIVLSNNNNSLTSSDNVYTFKQVINFNGAAQKIKSNFVNKSAYKKGKYKVELKESDVVKQTFSFELL